MILTPEQREEYYKVVKPVMEWLNNNCYPHVHVIIDCTSAELSEGIAAYNSMEFVKD